MSNFTIRRNHRSKHVRLSVHPDGRVLVSAPLHAPLYAIERFVQRKSDWIQSKLDVFAKYPASQCRIKSSKADFKKYKEIARALTHEKIARFNTLYKFTVGRISIRNQKTKWGSCSRNGNININYKIAFLPEHLVDYLIVHELCHLGEFNHSKKFWDLVGVAIPDYEVKRKELLKY